MNRIALTLTLLVSIFFTPRQSAYTAIGTSLLLYASPNPVLQYTGITITAVVTSSAPEDGTPSGTVTFLDGVYVLGTAPLNPNGAGGVEAIFNTPFLSLGTHTITAAYDGDGSFTGCSGSITVTVTDFRIAIHASAYLVEAGSPLTLTFTATNGGPALATSTVMNIYLPERLTFQSVTSNTGLCNWAESMLRCELGNLAPSTSQAVTVCLAVPRNASGIYTISGSLQSPSITPPGGPYPTDAMLLTVEPRSFIFSPFAAR